MPYMADILKNIPNNIAADMLKHERHRLETTRQQLVNEIKTRQHEIDQIDQRLTHIDDGEKALNDAH